MISLYHNPFYYHDPTIINVHTLLKPQTYQNPRSINTHISPPPTYPNSIDNTSLHYLIRHIDNATQQLQHSQRACISSISNFASEISSLNNSLTTPNFTYQQQPFITSTTVFHHNFNQHSHEFPPPNHLTYNTTTHFNNHPVNPQTFVSPSISTSPVTPTVFTPPPLKICTHPYKPPAISQITLSPYNSNHVPTEIDATKKLVPNLTIQHDPLKLVPNLTIRSAPDSDFVSEVVGKQQVVIAEDLNDMALSNLVLDSITTEADERLRDEIVIVKNQEVHQVSSPIPKTQPPLTHWFAGTTSDNTTTPAKYQLITTTPPSPEKTVPSTVVVAAPFPQHLFIFDPGVDERRVRSLAVISSNGVRVFDPGGDERNFGSPTSISVNNHGTHSPLQVPWDRGKNWSFQLVVFGDGLISGNYFVAGKRLRFDLVMEFNEDD